MNLPDDLKQLTTVEEVKAAWGDLFVIPGDDNSMESVAFAGNPRIAITEEAVFVKLRKPLHAGKDMELVEVLRIPEPTVGDVRQTDKYKGDVEKAICLLTTLCTIPTAEVNKMAASDMTICGLVINAFL